MGTVQKESRVKRKAVLTEKDFIDNMKDAKIEAFQRMLANPLYEHRVRRALYAKGKISAREFLFTEDVYRLPLGKKSPKKGILIDNMLMEIFDRFMMAQDMVEKNQALTAFLFDMDSTFYHYFVKQAKEKGEIDRDGFTIAFSEAYERITKEMLYRDMVDFMDANDEIKEAAIKEYPKEFSDYDD